MKRHLIGAVVVAVSLVAAPGASDTAVAGGDVDCSAFSTQAAAQAFFIANGGPASDPHGLDADGDGVACETLPCPCGSGGGTPPPPPPTPPAPPPDPRHGNVVRVIDGDTIVVRVGTVDETVRVVGIDTPELSTDPYVQSECGAVEAAGSMAAMATPGDYVRLVRDPRQEDRDIYGRLLRYVEEAGVDYGRVQIKRGWAKPFVVGSRFKRFRAYKVAKQGAKRARRGVWRACGGNFHAAGRLGQSD